MVKRQSARNRETFERLLSKTEEQSFINYIHKNTNLSLIESKVVMDEFIKAFSSSNENNLRPLQSFFIASKIDAAHGKTLETSDFVKIILTLHNPDDDLVRKEPKDFCEKYHFKNLDGTTAARRFKIHRITYEAYKQDAVLTEEDLAYRIFNCGIRTIQRDIDAFKKVDTFIPIRGTVCDIGKSISHKVETIKHLLNGMELSSIARRINHSPQSIERYVKKFSQVCAACKNGLTDPEISLLTESSYSLIKEYKKIYETMKEQNKLTLIENLIKNVKIPVKLEKKGGSR